MQQNAQVFSWLRDPQLCTIAVEPLLERHNRLSMAPAMGQ